MSVSRTITHAWNSLTPEDKARIAKVTGVHPDTCTTRAAKYAVLAEFYTQTAADPAGQFLSPTPPVMFHHPSGAALSAQRNSSETIEALVGRNPTDTQPDNHFKLRGVYSENYSEQGKMRKKMSGIPYAVLRKAAEYTLIVSLTIGGAYAGFSASRYTSLAEELRDMERNPVIYAYKIKEDLDSYHALKKFDVLSPDRDQAERDKEFINTVQEGVEGIANGAINAAKGAVRWIPWFGSAVSSLIDQKLQEERQEIKVYLQKREEHSGEMMAYTAAGTGSGLALGIIFSLLWRRRDR